MASRELIYRITLATSDAKRQAKNIRSVFETELRTIQVGKLDVSSAVSQAHQLRLEFEQAAQAARQVSNASSSIQAPSTPVAPPAPASGGINTGALLAGAGAYITLQSAKAIANYVMESAKLDTQIRRTEAAFEFLAGGAAQAEARLIAVQRASNGTISRLDAMTSSNQIAALGLARTAGEFEQVARAAKIVSTYSTQIKDFNDALSQLGLFANSAGYARADQLLINSGELVKRMAELKSADSSLTDSQAKLNASVDLLNQKFGPLLDSTVAQADGAEKLAVAWSEFTNQKSAIGATFNTIVGGIADMVDEMSVVSGFGSSRAILEVTKANAEAAKTAASAFFAPAGAERNAKGFEYTAKLLDKLAKGIEDGVPTALEYRQQVEAIAVAADRFGVVTDDQLRRLMAIDSAYKSAVVSAKNYNDTVGNPAEDKRQNMILDKKDPIEQALAGAAAKVAPTAGIEAAIATYRQQKALVDQAIQQLIDSGVSDQGELAVRVAGIVDQLTQPFDALEQRATAVDFGAFGAAFNSLNQGFADFLPGVSSAREELAQLSEELAFTGTMTAEQAAQFDYLASVAYAVGDSGSQLNSVVSELGTEFLSSNSYAAELVNQLFLAEVAFRNGQISAGTYAGITTTLSGRLLTLAQAAGIATGEIYALNQAQADMSNLQGFAGGQQIGGSISERIATQQAASGREQNRREMERYNRDMARAQERSAAKAGKLLEDGAKKANQELKSALDKVPGLFSTSSVSEKDMKDTQLGTYMNKADEKLRRLRDEVLNGKDWADVSIEDAKAALKKIGVQVANTKEGILQQFEDMWNSQALWADMSNIEQWIDKGAVEQQMALQKKSEEGRNNIYKYFGVQIDEATNAATGGGGGAAPKVEPPKLVDIDPLTEGLQTGLDEYVNANGQAIKEQVANAKGIFFDPANLFGTGGKTSTMGPMPNPTITVTADPTVQALTPYITGQQQATVQMQASGATFGPQLQAPSQGITLTPAIDATALQTEIDKLTPTVGVQLHVTVEEITLFKQTVAGIVSPSVSVGLKTSTEDLTTWSAGIEKDATSPNVEARINTTVGMLSDWMLAVEKNAPQPNVGVLLHTTVEEIALFKQTIAGIVKPEVEVDLSLAESESSVSTQLVTAITADIAANATAFATPGAVVAQLIMAAILANMQGGQQQAGGQAPGAGGPIAMAMVTNLATQFSTNANMFYATGLIPAQNVEAGFKGYQYSGMADNLQAQINAAIASKAGEFITVGGYIGGWISQGLNQSFNAEINLSFASNAGSAWATAFMKGAISTIGGGALLQSISDKVITDLATELEK